MNLWEKRKQKQTKDVKRQYHDDVDVAAASTFNTKGPLFCRYAESLQNTSRAARDLPNVCPECGAHVLAERVQAWEIVKKTAYKQRTYLLSNRFVVKCHRKGVGFACVLCARFRDRDTIVESAQDLVAHVRQRHDVGEYKTEPDIWETRNA